MLKFDRSDTIAISRLDNYYGVEITPEQRAEIERERSAKKLERSNAGKVLRRFSNKVSLLGFTRRSTWFAREYDLCVLYIHVHKYTFGSYFRLHYGVRVLNDSRDFIALGGPQESQGLEFGEDDESHDRCAEAMFSLVTTTVVPWFREQSHQKLLEDGGCLYPEGHKALIRALEGEIDSDAVCQSRALFGLE